jgi:transcriptional regulator with XRE-family HTH domain
LSERYPLFVLIRVMRFRAHLTQKFVVHVSRIDKKMYSFYETGRRVPSEERLNRIIAACGWTREEFNALVPTPFDLAQVEAYRVTQAPPNAATVGHLVKVPTAEPRHVSERRPVVDPLARFRRDDDRTYLTSSMGWLGAWR